MSLINSLLGPLSPRLQSQSEDQHELPLYHSPLRSPRASPLFPPPPIASNIYVSPIPFEPKARVPDDLLAVQRKARHLEEELQYLLDAQAEGLMAGLGDGQPEDLISNGSSTPTVNSIRRDVSSPTRRSARRKPSLRAARRGIYMRIQQMAVVKEEEAYLLDSDLANNKAILEKINRWERKYNGLEQKIQTIEHNETGSKAIALQDEASKLERDIKELEDKLWAMKARHRKVLEELSETKNSVEAKLSSYKSALSLLDSEIAQFLANPPSESNHTASKTSTFFSLPPKRRTLSMAKDYWLDEIKRLEENSQEVDIDREALEDGAVLWDEVVNKVTQFESILQAEMQKIAKDNNTRSGTGSGSESNGILGLISRMDKTIIYIESKLKTAESKNWKLLVCCIGAELEAFKQGQNILEDALTNVLPPKSDTELESVPSETEHASHGDYGPERLTAGPGTKPFSNQRFFDTDDDDPDPELLISHQDTDTD